MLRITLPAIAATLGLCTAAQAVTLTNASFEDLCTSPGQCLPVAPGAAHLVTWADLVDPTPPAYDFHFIAGWEASGATAGFLTVSNGAWAAKDGAVSIDLIGLGGGGISQEISGLAVGKAYEVDFWLATLAATSWSGLSVYTAHIGVGSHDFANFEPVAGQATPQDLVWTAATYRFTAMAPVETLVFAGSGASLLLDGMSIAPVPLPAAGVLSLAGLGALGLLRRRR